jgi:hypothetical protein
VKFSGIGPWAHFTSPGQVIGRKVYTTNSRVELFGQVAGPLTEALTPESASALLNLRADPDLEARIEELRRRANQGTLTPADDAEYKDFIEAVDIVSIMQAKARRVLSRQAA